MCGNGRWSVDGGTAGRAQVCTANKLKLEVPTRRSNHVAAVWKNVLLFGVGNPSMVLDTTTNQAAIVFGGWNGQTKFGAAVIHGNVMVISGGQCQSAGLKTIAGPINKSLDAGEPRLWACMQAFHGSAGT